MATAAWVGAYLVTGIVMAGAVFGRDEYPPSMVALASAIALWPLLGAVGAFGLLFSLGEAIGRKIA